MTAALNIILLGVFTLLEAITIGSVVSYFDQTIVLQALVITTFVFIGSAPFSLLVESTRKKLTEVPPSAVSHSSRSRFAISRSRRA